MQIAIVGSGISGLACAHILDGQHDVTLYEADSRLGGHANTVTVTDPSAGELQIDTGFIVHNNRNYPELLKLFSELNVETQASEMTFAVDDETSGICYSATSLSSLFAQRKNFFRPTLWRMLADIARFYRAGQSLLTADSPDPDFTIGQMLEEGGYSEAFIDLHLVPMGSAVWSSDPQQFLNFPADSLLRFLDNHGLLSWGNRPEWRTIVNGSKSYITALANHFSGEILLDHPVTSVAREAEHVIVSSNGQTVPYDRVILACHTDQSRKILSDPTADEKKLLDSIKYQKNQAILHTDASVLPANNRSWAAWNYRRPSLPNNVSVGSTVSYDLTTLQGLAGSKRYLVTLNSRHLIDREHILGQFEYAHPVFTSAAVKAQQTVQKINGADRLFFVGAWQRYGFHEDGIWSAVRACRALGVRW